MNIRRLPQSFALIALLMFAAATAIAAERQVTLAVDGMDCAACPITVRKALERVDGVKVTRVDVASGTMEAAVSDDAITDAQLLRATADAGYPSRIHEKSSGSVIAAGEGTTALLTADLEPLRTAFNAAKGKHRILAVVSPTCSACRLGVEAIQASVLSNDDPQLRVFVVWSPMLKRDNEETVREAAATLHDPRMQQFVDLPRYVGSVLRRDLFPNARAAMLETLPPEHYFREYAQAAQADKPEWDIYLSFPADAAWGDRVPQPDRWIRQTALFPNDEGQQISLMWLDSYRSMPVEGDLVKTMGRLLPQAQSGAAESVDSTRLRRGGQVKSVVKSVGIVPRLDAGPGDDWYPWLARELNVPVRVIRYEDAGGPRTDEVDFRRLLANEPPESVLVIGHSVGCQAALRALARLDEDARVAGLACIAG